MNRNLIYATGIAMLASSSAFAVPDDTVNQLLKQTEKSALILVGEMHGTREVPALVGELARCLAKPRSAKGAPPTLVIALEFPQSEAPALNAYFDSDGGAAATQRLLASPFWARDYQDGRSSGAMLELIDGMRKLAHGGRSVRLAVFDQSAAQEKLDVARDQSMAENLRAVVNAYPSARVLALTGNYHARQSVGANWDAQYRFMGNHLKDLKPYSIEVNALQGSYWGCSNAQAADCRAEKFGRDPADTRAPGLYANASVHAIGYDQALALEQFSVSLPARKAQ